MRSGQDTDLNVRTQESRVMLINEFAPEQGAVTGWNLGLLRDALEKALEGAQFETVSGGLNYMPGGAGWRRIMNLCAVYAKLPVRFFRFRPTHVVVMTSPPCIQIWALILARAVGAQTGFWAMDRHPAIESVFLKRSPVTAWLGRMLERIDRWALDRFDFILVLDEAMSEALGPRLPGQSVIVYPTLLMPLEERKERPQGKDNKVLRFVYAGNYGFAHTLAEFEPLLKKLHTLYDLELVVVGLNPQGERLFSEMSVRTGARLEKLGRRKPGALGEIFAGCDFGIVLLSRPFGGLLSPSKFQTYLAFGLPIVYCGPEKTNAHRVCMQFGGGIWVPPGTERFDEEILKYFSADYSAGFSRGARRAADFFEGMNADHLAGEIIRRWHLAV